MGSGYNAGETPEGYELPDQSIPAWHYEPSHGYESTYAEALAGPYGHIGPEISMAIDLETGGRSVAIAKVCAPGTGLAADWDPEATEGLMLYSHMIRVAGLLRDAVGGTYAGMVWVHGEEDAETEAAADAYEANLTAFIASTRVDMGVLDLKVYLCRPRPDADFPYISTIRTAMDNVTASDENVEIVDCDAFPLLADLKHYTDAGYHALGQAIAAAILP